jgi:hypothetical protein
MGDGYFGLAADRGNYCGLRFFSAILLNFRQIRLDTAPQIATIRPSIIVGLPRKADPAAPHSPMCRTD